MSYDQAKETYLTECQDLLQEMEYALLNLEQSPDDTSLVDAIFRAAHTIKGTSGVFGFDNIVSFTHIVESVLDRIRAGDISIESEMVALLLGCQDLIGELVVATLEDDSDNETLVAKGKALAEQLNRYLGASPAREEDGTEPAQSEENESSVTLEGDRETESDIWHISLRFSEGVLRDGMDPLSFLRYLGKLGTITRVTTLHESIPPMDEFNAEACYLGFEIDFESAEEKQKIEQVFEFVRDDCVIHILPPRTLISHYAQMIEALPEDSMFLGEILIAAGTLTETELADALKLQGEMAAPTKDREEKKKIGEVLVEQHVVHKETVENAVQKQKSTAERQAGIARSIRVDADKLDAQINLVGELVIAGARANLLAQQLGDESLLESISVMGRLVEEIRDSALRLRMVQIGDTFNRFQRVVRDVSTELGKDIRLEISGADTELDKTVIEKIGDPLMHLVRNAMDHGIEAADERQACGKPAQGVLKLNAYHDSGSIVIEVSDDGRGLDKSKILAKAREKGLVHEGQHPSEHEIYQLIFEPGFSTASKISNLSGRGVGMDVVKKNIIALRGTVDVRNRPGQGATVSIRLPLTLAIIDGFLVGVSENSYVVPLDMVVECIELEQGTFDDISDKNYINLRGDVLPFIRLKDMFREQGKESDRENIVVVQYGDMKAGLVVDELMGEFQTVIKPLGKIFQRVSGISGSTILGSGAVAIILDVPGLVQQAVSRHLGSGQAHNPTQPVIH